MELRQLRYFVRIIETGSMGRAALDLDIGVSALSQQMARLENELAIRLLQRTSRGVMPTSAGLAFYSQAQLAIADHDGPVYMRLLRGKVPLVLDKYDYQFELGKAKLLEDGNDVLIISSGLMTMRALEAVDGGRQR